MNQLHDPFEATPPAFHNRVEQKLTELQRVNAPVKPSRRWVAVLAACLVLAFGTALALDHFGVLYFLTERIWMGDPVDENAVVAPTAQSCDSTLLNASIRDAYWDGDTLSLTMNVSAKGDYAFYTETDRGCDGENFDQIWWNGDILPFEKWKNGREGLMLLLPRLKLDGRDITASWDWVQDEQGEAMLIEGTTSDLTNGAELTLTLNCVRETTGETDKATLRFTLPPMTKGEPKQ